MRWIAITGWLAAAVFALLYISGRSGSGPVYQDPEAGLLRERVEELRSRLAAGSGDEPPPPLLPPSSPPRYVAAAFTVVVVSASDLPDQDPLGTGDPFVIVGYDGEEQATGVIKGTRNPVWRRAFHFRHVEDQKVVFSVWDKDTWKHDTIGNASLVPVPGEAAEQELSLSDGGKLVVRVTWEP